MNDEFLSRTDGRSTVSTAPVTATSAAGATAAPRALTASLMTALVALVLAAHWLDHGPTGWAIALALFTVVSVLVVRGLAAHHPHPRFGPANLVTLGRAGLACVLAGTLPLGGTPTWPLWLVAGLAALLDGVDGWLARRSRLASRFGARFDLEIDALLILVLSLLVWRMDRAGAWILASGAMRYLFVAAMSAWPWLGAPLPESTRRKGVCVVQVVSLLLCLLPGLPTSLSVLSGALGLAALAASFAVDVRWLRRHHLSARAA